MGGWLRVDHAREDQLLALELVVVNGGNVGCRQVWAGGGE
jgi:hypothetical protein